MLRSENIEQVVVSNVAYFNTIFNIQIGRWDAYNKIVKGLWLGMLPTEKSVIRAASDLGAKIVDFINQDIDKMPLRLVISVVEEDELNGKDMLWTTTVPKRYWQENNIQHHVIHMRDHTANISCRAAIEAIDKIRETINAGGAVYTHCRAGRSRSAMLYAIYLSLFEKNPKTGTLFTLPDAVEYMRQQRKQVSLQATKLDKANEIIDYYQKLIALRHLLSQETNLAIALKHFTSIPSGNLVLLLSRQELIDALPDKEILDSLFRQISDGMRVYVTSVMGVDHLKKIFNDESGEVVNASIARWKEAHLKEILTMLSLIIKSPYWDGQGRGIFSRFTPSHIEEMRKYSDMDWPLADSDQLKKRLNDWNETCKTGLKLTRSVDTEKLYYLLHAITDNINQFGTAAEYESELLEMHKRMKAVGLPYASSMDYEPRMK